MVTKNSRGETHIDEPGLLHNDDGTLALPGFATSLMLDYRRSRIKASRWRIKEWDYYLVNDDEYAIALTLSDMGYAGLISASVIDFVKTTYKTSSVMVPFPMGRFHMPQSSDAGVSAFKNARVSIRFEVVDGQRKLNLKFKRFENNNDLVFEAVLDDEPRDTMVIATPWAEDPQAFYYNQKIVAMRARGSFKKGKLVHGFNPYDSFGLLDWGRGVWTRDNTWFWAVAQGWQQSENSSFDFVAHKFGFNLGYGFGDTTAASENMIFVDGVASKLGRVDFGIPVQNPAAPKISDRYSLMQPWHMTDDEGRLDLVFNPTVDRVDCMDFKLIKSDQHQVFGTFNGHVVLDDGTTFAVNELKGSAEAVHNIY